MNTAKLINEVSQLPSEAQHQIEDFIEFIKARYQVSNTAKISEEAFVGMWSDRNEMQDSSQWVKNARQSEWSSKDV